MQFDLSGKSARKRTYSKRKPKKKDSSLLLSDDDEPLPNFSNVEELLKDDNESEEESEEATKVSSDSVDKKNKEDDYSVDPNLPPLVDSKDTAMGDAEEEDEDAVDPAVAAREEREAIRDARRTIGLDTDEKEEEYSEPVRRSRRQKKKTPKMRMQEAAVKSKSKPHSAATSKSKARRGSAKSKNTKTRKAEVHEVSEGTAIRLFWEPTGTWSNGIVTQDWKDGYFTIEFEDDVKEQGALSYNLVEYDWFIIEDSKSNTRKGRKRKRNKDGDYTDDAAAPAKKQRVSGDTKSSEQKTEEMEAKIEEMENTIAHLNKEKAQYEGEKEEITKLLDTIEIKEKKYTNVMEKLKHILRNYTEAAED